jgi:hypothetical protein
MPVHAFAQAMLSRRRRVEQGINFHAASIQINGAKPGKLSGPAGELFRRVSRSPVERELT